MMKDYDVQLVQVFQLSNLKHCPVCGCRPIVIMPFEIHDDWQIRCGATDCPEIVFVTGKTIDDAIEKWNRRMEEKGDDRTR